MAIKATIYKAIVQLSDLDRNYYADHNLTIARHPSETDERMMIRLLAFVLNAPANNDHGMLEFGKDMWDPDEPCLIQNDLTGLPVHWIEIGQPDERHMLRASGRATRATVYSYGANVDTWWAKVANKITRATNLTVWQLAAEQTEALGSLASRSMNLQFTVQEEIIYVGAGTRTVEVTPIRLYSPR